MDQDSEGTGNPMNGVRCRIHGCRVGRGIRIMRDIRVWTHHRSLFRGEPEELV